MNDVVPLIDMFIAVLVAVIFFNNFIDCGESKESLIITKGHYVWWLVSSVIGQTNQPHPPLLIAKCFSILNVF